MVGKGSVYTVFEAEPSLGPSPVKNIGIFIYSLGGGGVE